MGAVRGRAMRLRPRQNLFVERSLAALCDHGNTLSIASTGFGKTIALSAVVARSIEGSDAKACILAHRDELTSQNSSSPTGRTRPRNRSRTSKPCWHAA